MIKKLILLIITTSHLLTIKAEEPHTALYYLKGSACMTIGRSEILPNFGVGMRRQNHHSGFDLSVNIGSLVHINYVSLKSLFLLYPNPLTKNQLYYGIGPSIGYGVNSVALGNSQGRATHHHVMSAMEVLIGYEFRHSNHLKTFIQLEFSQPLLHFGKSRYFSYLPGIALIGGLGF